MCVNFEIIFSNYLYYVGYWFGECFYVVVVYVVVVFCLKDVGDFVGVS